MGAKYFSSNSYCPLTKNFLRTMKLWVHSINFRSNLVITSPARRIAIGKYLNTHTQIRMQSDCNTGYISFITQASLVYTSKNSYSDLLWSCQSKTECTSVSQNCDQTSCQKKVSTSRQIMESSYKHRIYDLSTTRP